ncbi:DUF6270 domain-containing protein [Brevibacterium sp.]|uniref:DUF6270 domain-containing protein n=1 Tax=Brevibacterium sp. TaxID=1701 RepID=UPI002812431F|nr:DUF6270 domain-containing protein [Brevibacterium sp.]
MNIAIFGSCVSRDTCEFAADVNVIAYVARHSVTSLLSPHGESGVAFGALESPFQRRMVKSDLRGDGVDRLVKQAHLIDVVLIDLVDERRGFWLFPDGTAMTNSLEIELCGAGARATEAGARLVAFGTDEHFQAWQKGFSMLIDKLKKAGIWDKTILLDIEWAGAVDGAPHPKNDAAAKFGRRLRKVQRAARDSRRALTSGKGAAEALGQLRNTKSTESEEFADRAARANAEYVRYRRIAQAAVATVITRRSDEVRIGPDHKWGPQPFHYRDEDYVSIVNSIYEWRTSTNQDQRRA